ncbi:hypothetical protein HQ32_00050 [Prauserella sp. Am3]|nr:hypothetical protein HQ32_00050 [Prauserella sp. Am3]
MPAPIPASMRPRTANGSNRAWTAVMPPNAAAGASCGWPSRTTATSTAFAPIAPRTADGQITSAGRIAVQPRGESADRTFLVAAVMPSSLAKTTSLVK